MKILTLLSAMLICFGIALNDAVTYVPDSTSINQAERYAKFGIETKDGYLLEEVTFIGKATGSVK
ncbi:hypothetical protein [Adhaeribacter soli]|uniref:Uncharacterized protein n=1 Tax=Adhaeribacter soli TaxID=2607655 RepID=A0A5N1J6I2_9BACT|nr:hypothetical protein [Adhaeribacter soli]KAA9345562.1 hypothetical protein F0P94_00280 [Adhaeribacter soli]